MSRRFRMLVGQNSTTAAANEPPPEPDNVDSDFLLIVTAFLCALLCVLGLAAMARCGWIGRISATTLTGSTDQRLPASANKRLKKKVLKTLPMLTYSNETIAEAVSECAICLTEFATGDAIRVLPRCGHGFHVACIDIWFGSHSSCPSCRQILAPVPRCRKCGEVPSVDLTRSRITTAGETSGSINRFLP